MTRLARPSPATPVTPCRDRGYNVYIGSVRPENLPMTVQINNLVNQFGAGRELLGPAAFISMALPLVVFFSLQRYFVRGITGGAVKG